MPTEKQEISLYGGEVNITFYPNSHRYKLQGEKKYLVGTTTATGVIDKSRVLINWAVGLAGQYLYDFLEKSKGDKFTREELAPVIDEALKQHTIKKEEAASFGSQVHEWAEQFTDAIANGVNPPKIEEEWPEEVQQGINAYLDWYDAHSVKIEHSERMVYSKENEFVGTCDAIGEVDGKRYLIDYKTSKGLYPEHSLQVSAYMMAYEEETWEKLDGAMIVKFGKEDGSFEVKTIERGEVEENYKVFLSALNIKKWLKTQNVW